VEAATAVPDKEVTCILIDIHMKGLNGKELYNILRKRFPADVRMYALTAFALPDERKSILDEGFDGILVKPFKENELVGLVGMKSIRARYIMKDDLSDFGYLNRMAMGDEKLIRQTLHHFIDNSESDITEMRLALKKQEKDQVILLLHRISGRTAQLGSTGLASNLRSIEIRLQENMMNEELHDEIDRHILDLENFILTARIYAGKSEA
jgi:CheY-like chemotaxis protein